MTQPSRNNSVDIGDTQATRAGNRHQLALSRRASDAIHARATELSRRPGQFLELVIKTGLAQLAHLRPPPVADYTYAPANKEPQCP